MPVPNASLPYAVCGYCQTLILRDAEGLHMVGKAAALPFDVSPIELGTRGSCDGTAFDVVGRVRWGWDDGAWNEWLLALADGTEAWLGEAMGQFQLLFARDDLIAEDAALAGFAQGGTLARGTRVMVAHTEFVAADVKRARCLGGEGQLPFACPADWTIDSIDFRNADGKVLSLQRDGTETALWLGAYVALADLKPTGLRAIDGWTRPVLAA